MYNPLVSVIIPVYNTEKYLEEAINSIQTQSYKNLEIICIDDGSTDNSPLILEKLKAMDNRISIITQKNSGQSLARNNGMDIAKGKYVIFFDSDDILSYDAIKRCVEELENNNADIICFNMWLMTPYGNYIAFHQEHFLYYFRICRAKDYMYSVNFTNSPVSMVKRDFLIQNNIKFCENHIYEDWIQMIEVFTKNPIAIFLDIPFYTYRVPKVSNSTTHNISEKCLDLLDSYLIANKIISKNELNPDWHFVNDKKIILEASSFIKNKIWQEKNPPVENSFYENFINILKNFDECYFYCLQKNLPKENQFICKCLRENKKGNLKERFLFFQRVKNHIAQFLKPLKPLKKIFKWFLRPFAIILDCCIFVFIKLKILDKNKFRYF